MSAPVAEAPNLLQEAGSQDCFIPKVCIHTWTGHTQGVSVIRTFPKTGHMFISGSMDTKIKVRTLGRVPSRQCSDTFVIAVGYLYSRQLSPYIPWAHQSRKRHLLFE